MTVERVTFGKSYTFVVVHFIRRGELSILFPNNTLFFKIINVYMLCVYISGFIHKVN